MAADCELGVLQRVNEQQKTTEEGGGARREVGRGYGKPRRAAGGRGGGDGPAMTLNNET